MAKSLVDDLEIRLTAAKVVLRSRLLTPRRKCEILLDLADRKKVPIDFRRR